MRDDRLLVERPGDHQRRLRRLEGTQRRLWAKELGIEFVHIDPHCTPTAQLLGGRWIPIRPGTDAALAIAIMNVWVREGLYDKDYVEKRTTGFDEWRDYLLGNGDGVAKTPEWQEAETGVPAHVVRALARAWGNEEDLPRAPAERAPVSAARAAPRPARSGRAT